MYTFFSQISMYLSEPFVNAANTDIALIAALFLGMIGSLAPCQISANVAAITYFGNRQFQKELTWKEITMYVIGKIMVFFLLGSLFWFFGQQVSKEFIPFLAYARKALGPLLILIGFFLLGWIIFPFQIGARLSEFIRKQSVKMGGQWGAFFMGVAFSLGFCPTMYVLFFGTLMPLALQSSYGYVLPPIFAMSTAMPFLLFAGLTVGLGLDRIMVKRTRVWGNRIQKLAGLFFILFGISDTLTYWTL